MTNPLETLLTQAVLETLGKRIESQRLSRNLTQAELADQSGISKRTLERLEDGKGTQLSHFIEVLRSLGLTYQLLNLIPAAEPKK